MSGTDLLACHECDFLQRQVFVPSGGKLCCRRCDAELYQNRAGRIDRSLALGLASLVLLVVSNAFPIVGLALGGTLVQTTLIGAVRMLYVDGMWPVAVLVLVTTFLVPIVQTVSMLWILLPLRFDRMPWKASMVFRLLQLVSPWGMTEVLILGLLVALVKLGHIASVELGVALWSFGALMFALAAAGAAFDTREMWARIAALREPDGEKDPHVQWTLPHHAATAAKSGLASCHQCGLLARVPAHAHGLRCPRCGAELHLRKPASLSRTWALLIAAVVLYVPANTLPVMHTSSLFGAQKDTIMSGVVYLWVSGSWPLAVIVFIASVAVPMLKIIALAYLAGSVQFRWRLPPLQRARIYRVVEFIGRWSMLDIYVITMLVALVQFQALAVIRAGPAAIAFGAVVVLTMFAAMAFDPRLIWDGVEHDRVGNKA
jgi:paraquat-inducible protein A